MLAAPITAVAFAAPPIRALLQSARFGDVVLLYILVLIAHSALQQLGFGGFLMSRTPAEEGDGYESGGGRGTSAWPKDGAKQKPM